MRKPEPYAIDRLPAIGPAALCMGVFDGVHRGHLALAQATIDAAAGRGASSVALVFDPHPDEIVRPGTVVPRLAPLGENLRRLKAAGIDRPLPVRFDPDLRSLTPEQFLAALASSITLRALVMTPSSAFGRNRAGTPDAMRARGRVAGFELVIAAPVMDDGSPISSARVRDALAEGDLAGATRLLGHPPFLSATVIEPDDRTGRLRFAYPAALPAVGRYLAGLHVPADDERPAREVQVAVGVGGEASLDMPDSSVPRGPISLELRSRL